MKGLAILFSSYVSRCKSSVDLGIGMDPSIEISLKFTLRTGNKVIFAYTWL
jgi:hypothetical protein